MIAETVVGDVAQRVPERRQLPVEHRHHPRLGRMDDQVAEPVVAVNDGGGIAVVGNVLGQPGRELVHGRDVFGLELGILPAPARDLAGDVLAAAAIVAETDLQRVDLVKARQHVIHRIEDGRSLGGSLTGHRSVHQDAAGHGLHDIEHLADHGVVAAEQPGGGDRHIGRGEGGDDAVLAVDLMGRGDQLPRRFLAQHEVAAALCHVGGDEEGRVGMTRIELTDFESAAIALELLAEVAVEGGHVETVALHHGDGVSVCRHAASSVMSARGLAQTLHPAGRNVRNSPVKDALSAISEVPCPKIQSCGFRPSIYVAGRRYVVR